MITVRRVLGRKRGFLLVLLIAAMCALVSGCLRADTSLTLSDDDRVSGHLLLASQPVPGQPSLALNPPRQLADRVHKVPYSKDGYVGSELSFSGLTFDEVHDLAKALSPSTSRYDFSLRRSGSLVIVDGMVDLTPLANTDSSVRLELSVPGEVATTNGHESGGVITWKPQAGEVTQIHAAVQFAAAGASTWFDWAMLITSLTLGVAMVVALLALHVHRRMRFASMRAR